MNVPDNSLPMSEKALVAWFARKLRRPGAGVSLGVGDDLAILNIDRGAILAGTDMLLEGVHFDLNRHSLDRVGRKAAGCVLSDAAAMACEPLAALVSLALPKRFCMTDVETLYQGMTALFDVFDVPIVGGDTTAWTAGLVIDVALIGQPFADVHPVTRSGAKPGDTLYVTGPLGGSLRGSHLDFTPRVREAEQLARAWKSDLHAMIDITDGLALDLHRLCEASGLGAELDESAVQAVISDDAKALAAEGDRTPLDHALSDGEDFELLIAADASADPKKCHGVSLLPIGRVTAASVTMRHTDGATRPLLKTGYDHLA